MLRVILADDEPLVLVGLQNMLPWAEHDITICATARNGRELLQQIEKMQPDVVITDIKMPLLTGLEAAQESRRQFGRFPLFIMLSNFEDFAFAREALSLGAIDYLVKIELTAADLLASLKKARDIISQEKHTALQKPFSASGRDGMHPFHDKFFIRLLNNLFENKEQYELQKQELEIVVPSSCHTVCYCTLEGIKIDSLDNTRLAELNTSIVRMLHDTASRFVSCHTVPLDMKSIVLIVHLAEETTLDNLRPQLTLMLQQTEQVIRNYFSVNLRYSIGQPVYSLYDISQSFFMARRLSHMNQPLSVIFPDTPGAEDIPSQEADFIHRDAMSKALSELDTVTLDGAISRLLISMKDRRMSFAEAMDAACTILYLAFTLLPDGQTIIEDIFSSHPDGYRSIYASKSHEDIIQWLGELNRGLTEKMAAKRQDYRQMVVRNVQTYVQENIQRKLSLGEVSSLFGFSQNYLSHLFTKYAGTSFVEYITQEKISVAKEMMASQDVKVYEIAEKLGFENSFYFSKVFKKVTGDSPRAYMNRLIHHHQIQEHEHNEQR